MKNQLNQPFTGMSDLFGVELRRRQYVQARLADLARSFGYEQIEVPLVERASSFAEEVVGRSPWPEWDQRGCFYMQVLDYATAYDDPPEHVQALLIPEGTISVTRWLGRCLADDPAFAFPLKLFYQTPCFRNELINTLESGKARSFNQFGMEVLGADHGPSDLEAISLIATCLTRLGVPQDVVRVRIGDVAVFNRLVELSGLDADEAINLKEILDALAECKAGKGIERRTGLTEAMQTLFERTAMPSRWRQVWSDMAATGVGLVAGLADPVIEQRLSELRELVEVEQTLGCSVIIDLCVVRSHEYYTGIAFEIDVMDGAYAHVEVGGGGRYDHLIGHFTPEDDDRTVPATGFAFGVERLVAVLDGMHLMGTENTAADVISLRVGSADLLIVPEQGSQGYRKAAATAAERRAEGKRVDVYLGDREYAAAYASSRGILATQKD
jgi:histidyl-tRNA synthetase